MAAAANVKRVEVIKQFRHNGEALGVGSVVDMPRPIAMELASANANGSVKATN